MKNNLTVAGIRAIKKQLMGGTIVSNKKELTKKQAQTLLKNLVKGINQGGFYASHLWNVLSALRGPDKEDTLTVKLRSTVHIRSAIGLKTGINFVATPEFPRLSYDELCNKELNIHFSNHFTKAVLSLNKLSIKLPSNPTE
jgi:hypothetical protein